MLEFWRGSQRNSTCNGSVHNVDEMGDSVVYGRHIGDVVELRGTVAQQIFDGILIAEPVGFVIITGR